MNSCRRLALVLVIFGLVALFHAGRLLAKEPTRQRTHRAAQIVVEDSMQNNKLAKKSPKGAFVRSVIFPGWGQWYNDQKIKAFLAFSVESFLVGLSVYYNRKAGRSPEDSFEEEVWKDRRNGAYWFLLGAALLSGVDAYIDAHLHDFDTGPDLSLRVGVLGQNGWNERPQILGISFETRF